MGALSGRVLSRGMRYNRAMSDAPAARRALITGAAKGIGLATARRLAAEGARVAMLDVDADALSATATALGALPLHADVADEAAVERAVAEVVEAWGGLDVVVPNAAIQVDDDDRVDRLALAAWQRTLDVNLTGAFLAAKHGVRAMRGGGVVVFTGSPAGHYAIARGMHAYSASKAGIYGLVKVMAADLAADGIRVNNVLPGWIDTHRVVDLAEAEARERGIPVARVYEEQAAAVPMRRFGTASEVADAVAFLASSRASYITGTNVRVDGGWCLDPVG
jgi:NAD(P)-dependent dehydrogenase (short-subunit alcohol dehydrogenase family)